MYQSASAPGADAGGDAQADDDDDDVIDAEFEEG